MDDLEEYTGPPEGELESSFLKAANLLQSHAGSLDTEKLLYFYARYKQATEGTCNIPKPGFFDFKGKQKWEAWKSMGDMTKDEAMRQYVAAISDVDPDWELKVGTGEGPRTSWVRVSSLAGNEKEDDIPEKDKNCFDWVKENNVSKVKDLETRVLQEKDENGMTLLHWAADRGYSEMAEYLLERKINVNERDADGQTALHYAAACGHADMIRVLLDHGADVSIQDSDGLQAEECAEDNAVKDLLKLP
ncbi:acyl-CoA-binding domain-containing protein 6-like [Penaeus indicus]|uniref:acyl-CoA-binding domain-containing protein 6-like n=1 Tax=Penaeus indicus TaxID=29960 RepID=UPI00300D5475